MKLAIISGKGGTGKTTIAVSILELEKGSLSVDADVDASNMHLFYNGVDIEKEYFSGSSIAKVNEDLCINCGKCNEVCRFDAIDKGIVNKLKCEGCGACEIVCPNKAITLEKEKSADIYTTKTSSGYMVRADMEIGAEGSGLIISRLRKKANEYKSETNLTILDGSPGIGCSVISSITNNDLVLIVTEPTKSGKEDFKRVYQLTKHFNIPALACINKYDINNKMSIEIENYCKSENIPLVGKIPFDNMIIDSINNLKPIVYYENSIANKAIRSMWSKIKKDYLKEGER